MKSLPAKAGDVCSIPGSERPWRREWQPTPRKSHGQEEDYSPWGHKEWDLSCKDLSDGAQHKLCFNILIVCVGFVVVVVFSVIFWLAKTIVFVRPFILNTKYNISIFKVVNKSLTKLMGEGISDCIVTHVLQFSLSVASDSLRPHESQHARPPCPSPTPGVYSDSCP